MVTPTKVKPKGNRNQSKAAATPQHKKQSKRKTPTTPVSNRGSPCFAGSKCFEPPTPDSLPMPPKSWTPTTTGAKKSLEFDLSEGNDEAAVQHLKMLLKVQA